MTLFLIAHKVRGEPAFDIAVQLEALDEDGDLIWIIPTSGHRAYPWAAHPLSDLEGDLGQGYFTAICADMPPDLPDHYPHRAEPAKPRLDITALIAKPPSKPIRRRA